MTLSIFVLGFAFGPLVLGPLSEVYGRVKVLQAANLFYFTFNTACGGSRSKGQLIAFRFLAGLGGSAALTVRLPPNSAMFNNVLINHTLDWRRYSRGSLSVS
jgi:MFS family permease